MAQTTRKVQLVLPMNLRCNGCGTYIPAGTKFTGHMHNTMAQALCFDFKCASCLAEIIFRRNSPDGPHVVESGATREDD